MVKKLNLGCGYKPEISTEDIQWINIDLQSLPGVNIVRDLRRGIPFEDETFEHCLIDNVLEHFNSEDAIFIINEISRVLIINGTCSIIIPHGESPIAKQDPTHKTFWVPQSAIYWNQTETSAGGKFCGITANLYADEIEIIGEISTAAFIHFHCTKRILEI